MGSIARHVAGALAMADDPEALGPPLLHLLGSSRETVLDKEQNVRLGRRFLPSFRNSWLREDEAPPCLRRLIRLCPGSMAGRRFSNRGTGSKRLFPGGWLQVYTSFVPS